MTREVTNDEIRRRIAAGLLPRSRRFRSRRGSLETKCDACGQEISRSSVAYEADLLDNSGSVSRTLSMHQVCYSMWLMLSLTGGS